MQLLFEAQRITEKSEGVKFTNCKRRRRPERHTGQGNFLLRATIRSVENHLKTSNLAHENSLLMQNFEVIRR